MFSGSVNVNLALLICESVTADNLLVSNSYHNHIYGIGYVVYFDWIVLRVLWVVGRG